MIEWVFFGFGIVCAVVAVCLHAYAPWLKRSSPPSSHEWWHDCKSYQPHRTKDHTLLLEALRKAWEDRK